MECKEEGAQWEEKQRYITEIKGEWDKEKEKLRECRDYLAQTMEGLFKPSSQAQHLRGAEEPV